MLITMKQRGKKIFMLTAYDFTTTRILDEAGIDAILVGDSAADVMAGYDTTVPMTVGEMIVYAASVVRDTKHALVVCDMPLGSYTNPTQGIDNAVKIMQQTGCDALKLEGGAEICDTVRKIIETGIPVMGHLGLTPPSTSSAATDCVPTKNRRWKNCWRMPNNLEKRELLASYSKKSRHPCRQKYRRNCPSRPSAAAACATDKCSSWMTCWAKTTAFIQIPAHLCQPPLRHGRSRRPLYRRCQKP